MIDRVFQRRWALLGVVALCSIAASAPQRASAGDSQIVIKGFMFMPTAVTIKVGSSVTWANKDDEPHTIASDTGLFRSGAIDSDESFTFKFDRPGTYHYTCSIHPRMVGTIVVQ